MDSLKSEIVARLLVEEAKALRSLAGYKFLMFGYHAAKWVSFNQLLPQNERYPNPFKFLVKAARDYYKMVWAYKFEKEEK